MKLFRIHHFYDGFPLYRIVGSIVLGNVEVFVHRVSIVLPGNRPRIND